MAPHLRALYGDVRTISGADSFIEGGDILTTETEILVGRSARTNAAGIAELTAKVAALHGQADRFQPGFFRPAQIRQHRV